MKLQRSFSVNFNEWVARENSRHFATPLLVSPRNDVWETTTKIPYRWRVTTQIWVVHLIGYKLIQPIRSTTQICIFFKEFLRSFLRHQRALYLRTRTATTSTRFNLKCFRIFSKNVQSFTVLFFTWKVSAIIFIGDSLALSRSQNDWTCSCHYDILAKTRSRMTTATTFSRQNDVGSRASTTQY